MADRGTGFARRPDDGLEALEVVLPATPGSVGALRSQAREFAAAVGAAEEVVADVSLAVSEAATNAVIHGYEEADVEGGTVELRGALDDDWLELSVSDRGAGFRPSPSGGLGFGLKVIAEVSDSMTVEQREHGTTIVLRFALARDGSR